MATPESSGGIPVTELKVGEHQAMTLASTAFSYLKVIDIDYLTSLIARMEADKSENTTTSLPIFKLVLFYAKHTQDYIKSDAKLDKALKESDEQAEKREFMDEIGTILP